MHPGKSANGDEKTMAVAAALTAGGTDTLIEGRHGVFVDNAGQDWDTALLRLVHNPISLREAMWAPYVRFGNMVADQLQKFVASKDDAISKASSNAVAAPGQGHQDRRFGRCSGNAAQDEL